MQRNLNNIYCMNDSACGYCIVKSCADCLSDYSFCTEGEVFGFT